ncbi:MAG: sensor histidine kinase [Enterocloster sp.]
MRCAIKERQQKEEEAGKANRELVTAMSHDLRTPLTSLLGYVDILQMEKGEDRGQQRKYLNSIRDKAYQIKELSDKLFEYFIVYGRKREELEAEEVNGAEFLNQIVEESLFDMESEGFDIRRSSDEINCRLLADINLGRRVSGNIFSNLLKYADRTAA